MTRLIVAVALLAAATQGAAQATMELGADGLPAWAATVGARTRPTSERVISANEYGAVADTTRGSTAGIQRAIDAAFRAGGGVVTFQPGSYVTGAIFVKGNVHLRVDAGVTLLGSRDDADSAWTAASSTPRSGRWRT